MKLNFYKLRIQAFRYLLLGCVVVSSQEARSTELMVQRTEAGERLENVLKKMEQKFNVNFVYDANEINKNLVVDIANLSSSLESALKQLSSHGLIYKKVGTNIILKKEIKQKITVKGTVTAPTPDGTGTESLPGVNVSEKGSNSGTSTNANGEYTITVSGRDAVLVFSFLGYKTEEVPLNGRTSVNVKLEEDVNSLKQVVVTGYQNISKRLFTGSSASVSAKEAERAGVPDISRMLEGQVAGVSVQNVSGTFGAAPKIRIRGATSISGDNKPLWVVDGIILEDIVNISNEQLSTGDPSTLIGSSVAGLNADDIESFEILRDAAATSMYGARAMNGVVVVTTKKGRNTEGKTNVSYSGNFTTFLKPTYNQFDIMNSADQMQIYLEMENKGWLNHSDVSRSEKGGVFRKMYDLMYEYNPETDSYALRNDRPSRLQFLNRYANANTDWFDVLFKNSLMQDHSISFSSGSAKSQFYASTSFLNDNGWTIGNGVKRFTGKLRGNFSLSKKLDVELITQGSVRDQQSPGTVNREENTIQGQLKRDFDINPYTYALNTSRTLTPYDVNGDKEFFVQNYAPFNILHELENNSIKTGVLDFMVQGGLKYSIIEGLKYSFLGSYRFAETEREHSITEYANAALAYRAYDNQNVIDNNRFLYQDPSNPGSLPQIVLPEGGFFNSRSNSLVNYYMRHAIDYEKVFNRDHIFNAFAVTELRYIDKQAKFNNGVGYQFDRGGIPFLDPLYFKQSIEANSFYYGRDFDYERYLSYSTRLAYSYQQKYNINFTGRYDGSNLLGQSATARWLPTWNVSGAWNIDGEDFFKKQDILSRATIRASYGLTASLGDARNSSIVLRSQTTRRTYDVDKEASIYIDELENSELTWEKQYETNIGFNVGALNDRLGLTVDFYKRNAYDLIGLIRSSGIGGQGLKVANYADMKSKGVEMTLNSRIIEGPNFKWSNNINFGYHKGEITSLENLPSIFDLITENGGARVGYPQRGLFSVVFDGLNPENGVPTFTNEDGERNSTEVDFQSSNIDNLKYEGQIDPKLTGGFSNRFTYKNFSLSALVTFSAGNKVRLYPSFNSEYTDLSATSKDFLRRWTLPGDEAFTNVPSIVDRYVEANFGSREYPYSAYNYSTVRVADGGFARLKQVMVTYQLPKTLASHISATNASISVVGNNLWLIYSDKRLNGQDPEFFSSGGVALPIPRQISLSLKVGF